jgi:hypothetical protein
MAGLYLYCLREPGSKIVGAVGIDGRTRVFVIPYKGIEAVVSEIDVEKFGSKEVASRAKEDVKWIIKHAARHEKVIEKAAERYTHPVIPAKFGTIYRSKRTLEASLAKRSAEITALLKKLTGTEEWGVKVYVQKKKLREEIKSTNAIVKAQFKKASDLPRGEDYFQEAIAERANEDAYNKAVIEAREHFFDTLAPLAVEAQEGKILAREFTGTRDPMVLNSAYLVKKENVSVIKKAVRALRTKYPAYRFLCTGPWPPYNFV